MTDHNSSPQTLDQAYQVVLDDLLQMFLKKHKDYGKGNILANGEIGIAMRVAEKVERLKHLLMTNDQPANESLEETWIDIAVYGVLAVLLRRGQFEALDVDPEALKRIE
jgi:hypothetical protein